MALQSAAKLTYDDYVLIPDDGLRHEIIEGEHYVDPAPNVRHQLISRRIFKALVVFADDHDLGEVFYSPIDVVFSEINVVQPDIVYIRKENRGELYGAAYVKVIPDLVVEVLSMNRKHDEITKLKLYDGFNVPEYWIADPKHDVVNVYRRRKAGLTLVEQVRTPAAITSPLLPGFSLPAQTLFTWDPM